MNNTTKTDILKYILNIELQIQELKNILQISSKIETSSISSASLTSSNGSIYNVFLEIEDIIEYYINNIGFPNMGKNISNNQLKFKTIKFLEKYNCSKSVVFEIIKTLNFDKNISYDKFLSQIESKIAKQKDKK